MQPASTAPVLVIARPTPGQEFELGVDIAVGGSAVGVPGAEPHPIDDITVQVDAQPAVSANLESARPPGGLAVSYTATLNLTRPGEHQIRVTAVLDNGRSVTRGVTVATRGSTNCATDLVWTNYSHTQSIVPASTCRPQSLDSVVNVVRNAQSAGQRVHASGSRWSFSDCAMTTDCVAETRSLFRDLDTVQRALLPGPGQSMQLHHVEAGVTIGNLYRQLDHKGMALETMGGASGQTLAGAISTGTHGADKHLPPLADSVLAIHLVGLDGTQYWIEPTTGITDPDLVLAHVAPGVTRQNIIYDDRRFNACLVALGCMGVIYAVVLRVRGAYDLVETTTATTWRQFRHAGPTHISDPATRFLQVLLNPYRDSNSENLCLMTTRTESAPTAPANRPTGNVRRAVESMIGQLSLGALLTLTVHHVFDDEGLLPEQRLAKIVQGILTHAPDQRGVLTANYSAIMTEAWPQETFQGASFSVMDLDYSRSTPPSPLGYSMELSFPAIDPASGGLGFADFADRLIGIVNAATDTFFTGYISMRISGATRASLGMQQWNPTCSIEISTVQGVAGLPELLTRLYRAGMDSGALPHWGQMIDLGTPSHASKYRNYLAWRESYAAMSGNFSNQTFANRLSARWNLTTASDALFLEQSAPQAIRVNQTRRVSVTMRNTGASTWTRSGAFRLGSHNPADNTVWGPARLELTSDVRPGEIGTFTFDIVAPAQPGTYPYQWRMLQESVEWFGQPTPLIMLGVDPPAGFVAVPDVRESAPAAAVAEIRAAGLVPVVVGSPPSHAWMSRQTPRAGTIVNQGSTVTLNFSTGPIP